MLLFSNRIPFYNKTKTMCKKFLLLILIFTGFTFASKAVTVNSNGLNFNASYTSDCTPATVTFTSITAPPGTFTKQIDFDYTGYVSWTGATINHTYTVAGTYDARVRYYNSMGNYIGDDWVRIEIFGQTGPVYADYGATAACPGDPVRFRVSQGWEPFSSYSYAWDWGDGSPIETSDYNDLKHAYAAPGTYNITVVSNGPCGGPFVSTGSFNINTNVPLPTGLEYNINVSPNGVCPGQDIYFYYPEDYVSNFVQWGDGLFPQYLLVL